MNRTILSKVIQRITTRKTPVLVCFVSLFLVPVVVAEEVEKSEKTLENLVVTGTALSRYDYDEASSATGFNIDIDEVPRTIQVLPEQLILDQGADNIVDVLTNAAGVTRAHGFGGTENQVNIRGFTNSRTFVDGSPVSRSYNVDVADVDRVEVVLGPASILNGQVSPGGLINIITKAPQRENANTIQVEVDEHGKQKLFLDSTGSLSEDFQYRFIASGEDSDSYREVKTTEGTFSDGRENYSVSPSISYTPNDLNTFTLRLNYTKQNQSIDRGTVAVQDDDGNISIADIPRSRSLGTEHDKREGEEYRAQFNWDSVVDDNYNWTNKLAIGLFQKDIEDYQGRPVRGLSNGSLDNSSLQIQVLSSIVNNVRSNGLLLRQSDTNTNVRVREFSISDSIVGEYQFLDINNTLVVAGNYNRRTTVNSDGVALTETEASAAGALGSNIGEYVTDFDIIDIYSDSQDANPNRTQSILNTNDETFDEYGLSIQNLTQITDNLNVLLGLRYDRFESDINTTRYYEAATLAGFNKLDTAETGHDNNKNDNFSGQAGILWKLNENISIYNSYAESFTPNYVSATAGIINPSTDFSPEEASQFEAGVKTNFINDKLRLSVAAYNLKRENVLKYENLIASLNGEERTRGVDVSSTMQFFPGLNALATYSYLDSEIVDDNGDGNNGNTPSNVPKNKARAWGSYEAQTGALSGLGFGLGAEYVGSRYGDDANTFKLPSYTTFDTALWMYFKVSSESRLRLQGGIKNFTDETYYPANGSGSTYRINVGEPRTFYASARLDF